MKKALLSVLFVLVFVSPLEASAAINSLNGLTSGIQFLGTSTGPTNSMHMEIVQVGGNTNRFRWDGTPWRIDQGGTGIQSIPLLGQLLMGDGSGGYSLVATTSLGIGGATAPGGSNTEVQFNDGGTFAGESNFSWDKTNKILFLTGSSDRGKLFGSAITDGIEIQGGDSVSTHDGGALLIKGGDGSASSNAGSIAIAGGNVNGGSGSGGSIAIGAGYGGIDSGAGGNVEISAGNAQGGDGDAGNVFITPGIRSGSGALGYVSIVDNPSGNQARLGVSLLSTNRTFSFPNLSGTFGLLEAAQTWSGVNIFTRGSLATSTITIGSLGDITSRTCINMKNSDGQDVSLYVAGTSLVVEANPCN